LTAAEVNLRCWPQVALLAARVSLWKSKWVEQVRAAQVALRAGQVALRAAQVALQAVQEALRAKQAASLGRPQHGRYPMKTAA